MSSPPALSVIIATQRRPDSLVVAARSVMRQTAIDLATLELVIVDNDAEPSAQVGVARLAGEAPFPVRYVHEPKPGVASARNAAVEAAQGGVIAFLDDDQEASPGWLAALMSTRARFDADAVFGPVRAAIPDDISRHRRYFERFFTYPGPATETETERGYGAGRCLVVRASLPDALRPFALARDQSGGEDDALFSVMKARGARFAWNPQAWVWEHPARERIRLAYALRRTFAYGQGGTHKHLIKDPPARMAALGSMLTGVAQAVILGLVGGLLWLVRARDRAFVYDKATRGLGKVFCGQRFRLQFYGLRVGERPGRRSPLAAAERRWPR